MGGIEFKQKAHAHLLQIVEEKLLNAQQSLSAIQESKNSETKSSAGDKHETGRAMMQREEEQANAQLAKALKLRNTVFQMDNSAPSGHVAFGSLVLTDQGSYYISVGLGKIEVADDTCFAVSPTSPIGNAFLDKKVGENVVFSEKKFLITGII